MTDSVPAPELVRSVLRIVAARKTPPGEVPVLVATLFQALQGLTPVPVEPVPPMARPAAPRMERPRRQASIPEASPQVNPRVNPPANPQVNLPASPLAKPQRSIRQPVAEIMPVAVEAEVKPVRKRAAAPPRQPPAASALETLVRSAEAPAQVAAVPGLMRRADMAGSPPVLGEGLLAQPPRSTLRGIVKWFDPKTRRGALRMPGFGDEVAVDDAMLARAGIARLFKGQEIEAAIVVQGTRVQLVSLALPGRAADPNETLFGIKSSSSRTVSRRQAKPVVIELKRDALRRAGARVEAENLLGDGSNRNGIKTRS